MLTQRGWGYCDSYRALDSRNTINSFAPFGVSHWGHCGAIAEQREPGAVLLCKPHPASASGGSPPELSEYAGTTLDFQAHPAELQLLLDLCRYIYNNASEDFETNFRSKLISLRARYQVEAMEEVADG